MDIDGGYFAYIETSAGLEIRQNSKGGISLDDWTKEFGSHCFITDLGGSPPKNSAAECESLGRYAAWAPFQGQHRIVEVGSDLKKLRQKYGVPVKRVCTLVRR